MKNKLGRAYLHLIVLLNWLYLDEGGLMCENVLIFCFFLRRAGKHPTVNKTKQNKTRQNKTKHYHIGGKGLGDFMVEEDSPFVVLMTYWTDWWLILFYHYYFARLVLRTTENVLCFIHVFHSTSDISRPPLMCDARYWDSKNTWALFCLNLFIAYSS